jgi:hypothetical protein
MKYQEKITRTGAWELHAVGCADLHRNARSEDSIYDVEGDSPEMALAVSILDNYCCVLGEFADEFDRTFNTPDEVLAYFNGRVLPCCEHGPVAKKPVAEGFCTGQGMPFKGLDRSFRRLYMPCPVCGKAVGTGTGTVPRHKPYIRKSK